MNPFFESFQKELGKALAQAISAALLVIFAVAGISLPRDMETARTILIVLSGLALLTLAGGLFFRYLSYRESKGRIKEHDFSNIDSSQPVESNEPLTEIHENVLSILFKEPSSVKNICIALKITNEEAKYYLYDLLDKYMVETPTPYAPGPEEWRISQKGRKHIIEKAHTTTKLT